MAWSDAASYVLAPYGSAPREVQRLAQTGTTEATNATALSGGQMATILVGAAAIRINFGAATAPGVAATDMIIGAYGRFDWTVEPGSAFISIEAADGAAAYEAWVWTSSPGQ